MSVHGRPGSRWWRSPSLAHVSRLAGAAALAQAVPLAVAPVLTRHFDPAELGAWALFAAVSSTLATVACARYEYSIVVVRRESDALTLFQLCIVICGMVTLVTALAVAVIRVGWGDTDFARTLGVAAWWLPLAVAVSGAMQSLTLWHNRRGHFPAIARARVAGPVAVAGLQVGAALARLGAGGLVAAQVLGACAGPLVLIWSQWRREGLNWPRWRWRRLRRVAIQQKTFPLVNGPHAFVNALQEALAIGIIGTAVDSVAAGHYAMMMRLAKAPVSLVGGAMADVLLSRLARQRGEGADIRPLLRRASAGLAAASTLIAIPLALSGPEIFGWFLGAGWETAGGYAQILVPYFVAHFVVGPLTVTPMVIGRQPTAFAFSMVGNLLFVGAIAGTLGTDHSLEDAFAVVSVTQTAYFLAFWLWMIRASRPVGGKNA